MKLTMALLALGLVACGPPAGPYYGGQGGGGGVRGGAKPDWVDGTPGRYPRMTYMTGTGHHAMKPSCENDARGAVAKIFESRVHAVSKDWMGHFSRINAAGKVQVEAMAVTALTQVSTDYVIKGVKIAEVWRGADGFHCLAILDRFPAARTLREAIGRLDVEIAAKVAQGDAAADDTSKFFAYKGALEILQRREALNAELRIVSPTGAGVPPVTGWAELIAKFTGARARIKIGLKLTGRDARKMQTCLAQRLVEQKMTVTETSNDVDLFIVGNMKWQKAGYNNGQYMVKVDVNVRIMNMSNGKTVGAFAEDLKSGRPQMNQALQTTSTKLCHVLGRKLAKKIVETLSR